MLWQRTLRRGFWRNTPWQSRAHRAWFRTCAVCLSLYAAYVTFLAQSPLLTSAAATVCALLFYLLYAAALYGLLLFVCVRLPAPRMAATPMPRGHMWLWSVGITLCILVPAFFAAYPGGVSYDAANQWQQAHTGEFNNWHPLFHTLLIWMATRLWDSYPFVVCLQILAFAAAMGYLSQTLNRHGVPAWLALTAQALATASPLVKSTLMGVCKDNAMCIGVLVLTAQSINLLYTKGAWLAKARNAVAFGLMLAFVTLVRHNALLYTLPLLACVLATVHGHGRRKALVCGVLAACVLGVQGPLYGALDVVYPSNTLEEAVGIPMTILCNQKQDDPALLSAETNAFLDTLADAEAWQTVYQRDRYNSIKFTYPRELIAKLPPEQLLRMTLDTVRANPRGAFDTVNAVTDLVWGVSGGEAVDTVHNSGDLEEARYGIAWLNRLGDALCQLIDVPMSIAPIAWLTRNLGVAQLALLVLALWALRRLGVRALALAVPALLYNLGTMLLLCGADARFFQFSMAVCLPSMLALLYAPTAREL
ncbi:MAG: hypothetical protein RR065_02240 [Clostridia bacterium]